MKFEHNTKILMNSYFQKDAYIPIKVVFREANLNRHIGFYYNDSALAEFVLDYNNGTINSFVLTLTNDYAFHDAMLDYPESLNGEIRLYYPARNQCSAFVVNVYLNGVHVTFSTSGAVKYIRSGQLILGIDGEDNITDIYIAEMTSDEVEFVKNELNLG